MAFSSDEIIKREIIDKIGHEFNGLSLRIYPESSNADQLLFGNEGGLTFGVNGILYGSCDVCWVIEKPWKNPYNNKIVKYTPVIALEGTDALNRGSSGNAQYQRFHHVLGAVKAGLIGVYYLKKGVHKIQEDLFEMAYNASNKEKGFYLILNELDELKELLSVVHDTIELNKFLQIKLKNMHNIFKKKFDEKYGYWESFAKRRSTIIKKRYIIKYSGRMVRNFTDSSQRAGHIAVGEMFLTKYFFPDKHIFYLWPKMDRKDIEYLDKHKKHDKEWILLRNEKGVTIITIDDLENVPSEVKRNLKNIKECPLKGEVLRIFNKNVKIIAEGLDNNLISIKSLGNYRAVY